MMFSDFTLKQKLEFVSDALDHLDEVYAELLTFKYFLMMEDLLDNNDEVSDSD